MVSLSNRLRKKLVLTLAKGWEQTYYYDDDIDSVKNGLL
jgi:hypothetical protein